MASRGWYAQKLLKLKKENVKQRKESMAISSIDEFYAKPFKKGIPSSADETARVFNVIENHCNILAKYGLC